MIDRNPVNLISPDYRELIETANLDWQVSQYVRYSRIAHEHSANEIKAAAIAKIGRDQYGQAFDAGVAAYESGE